MLFETQKQVVSRDLEGHADVALLCAIFGFQECVALLVCDEYFIFSALVG
jgi:hypothetical protein